jgi:hypothetical protein
MQELELEVELNVELEVRYKTVIFIVDCSYLNIKYQYSDLFFV